MNGVLIVAKPRGWTSHDVVNKARRILQEKRIGHTGTLDPLATGVLVLCIGKATRLVRYLESDDKEYVAELRLGMTTDTQDAEGQVIEQREYAPPSSEEVRSAVQAFVGPILQRPPSFSALKIKGVPSHRLARRGAAPEHPERTVIIHSIELISYQDPYIRFRVHCSKGTYIRTLCADIGRKLGPGAHLTALTRTRAGRFTLDQAKELERLAGMAEAGSAGAYILSLSEAMGGYPAVTVGTEDAARIAHGNTAALPAENIPANTSQPCRVLGKDGALIAVARFQDGFLRPEVVVA